MIYAMLFLEMCGFGIFPEHFYWQQRDFFTYSEKAKCEIVFGQTGKLYLSRKRIFVSNDQKVNMSIQFIYIQIYQHLKFLFITLISVVFRCQNKPIITFQQTFNLRGENRKWKNY